MTEPKQIGTIGNYDGCLEAWEQDGVFYWAIQGESSHIEQIPEYLYRALLQFEEERETLGSHPQNRIEIRPQLYPVRVPRWANKSHWAIASSVANAEQWIDANVPDCGVFEVGTPVSVSSAPDYSIYDMCGLSSSNLWVCVPRECLDAKLLALVVKYEDGCDEV